MKKAFINCLVFALFLLASLYLVQYIVDSGLRKSKGQYFDTKNSIYGSELNSDLLIFGASRAKLVISPKILDSVLHINTYNMAVNGSFFPAQNALFKIYLQHNRKPKYIVQSVDYMTFTNGNHLVDFTQYLPYLGDPLIRRITQMYEEKFTMAELYLPLFKYNNNLSLIKEGICCYFNIGHRASNKLYKGYGPFRSFVFDNYFEKRITDEADFIKNNIQKEVDSEFVSYLEFCKKNDIKVIFYHGPVIPEAAALMRVDSSDITRKIIAYSREYNIPYLSYIEDSICYHKELFADHTHLNHKGVQMFNEQLANDLKKIIGTGKN